MHLIDGRGMCRSYSYVCGNSPENECIGIYVISEREKYVDACLTDIQNIEQNGEIGISGQEDTMYQR